MNVIAPANLVILGHLKISNRFTIANIFSDGFRHRQVLGPRCMELPHCN